MANTTIPSELIAADAITGAKIADNAVDSEHYTDGSIDTAHIADSQVTVGKMAANSVDSDQYVDGSIDLIHMSVNSIDSDQYVDGSIDTAHIADAQITVGKMAANSVDSDQYVDGSIDTAHIADAQITVGKMAANSVDSDQYVDGSIDLIHMSVNSIDSDQYVDGSIDLIHMSVNSVDSDQYVDGSIDTIHIADDAVTGAKIENAVTIATSVTSPLVDGQNFKINGGQGSDGQLLTSTGSGVAWEDAPASGPTFKTFGTSSIMIGDTTTGTIDAANYNVGLGVDVFAALTSGDSNIAIGFDAADTLTTGSFNVAIGTDSLGAAGSGVANNIMIGYNTGYGLTGDGNVAIGHTAFDAAGDRDDCVAIGNGAATTLTTGSQNVAIGTSALGLGTTANGNVCIGFLSASSLVGGSGGGRHNVSIGRESMEAQASQEDNVAIGYQAMHAGNSTSNSQNTIVGSQAMSDAGLAGYGNTVMGYLSGSGMTSAIHNTLIGRQADTVLTTGDENIVITSYNARTSAAAGTGQIVIGHNIVGKGNNTGLFGGASGVYNEGNTTAWQTVSDERIKKNITDNNIGLEAINKIQVRNFEYRTEDEITELPKESVIKKEGNQVGVIAQEIQEILPDLVKEQTTGCLSVNSDNLTWYLINAIQELSAEIKELKGE
jgi:hypothetical protein